MHQLRVHLAHLGTPLLGDPLYDAFRTPDSPAPVLHAARLVWVDPPGAPGVSWTWEAALPGARRVGP
jgi:tRNA pseudouridine32 synthase/23S rRNA pseudouridine746 synthase